MMEEPKSPTQIKVERHTNAHSMMTNYALKVGLEKKNDTKSRPTSSFRMNPNTSEPLMDTESMG